MANTADIISLLAEMNAIIQENKDYLTQLDMPIGDSDHGINLARGFQAVGEKLPGLAGKDVETVLKTVGMTLVSSVGGASGPLYGTAFMKAAAVAHGKQEVGLEDFLAMLSAAVEGVKLRGKATTGEQTMLDAMVPALEAMEGAKGAPTGEVLAAGLSAARAGVERTKDMVATKGRASYLGERSLGHQDPGATSFALLFSVIARHWN